MSASNITQTDATLEARIDPGDLNTTYQFQLAEDACGPPAPGHASCLVIIDIPLPNGAIPASSSEAQAVSLDLNAAGVTLHPGTQYRYSIEATNSAGPTVVGPSRFFATLPAPAPSPSPPTIERLSTSNITQTDATLEAEINPNGLETIYEVKLEAPSCQSVNSPGSCEASGGVQIVSGTIPAAFSTEAVSVDIAQALGHSLSPSTSYGYSVNATNSAGETFGNQKEFTTPTATPPPSITSESTSNITSTDATLEAQINPQSTERGVHYQLQVVTSPGEYLPEFACPSDGFPAGTSLCLGLASQPGALPIGGTPAGIQDQSVSFDLAGVGMTLQPSTTYHYRVIAARIVQTEDTIAWEPPMVYGPDQTFTTLSQPLESIPLGAQSPGGGVQSSSTIQSSPAAMPPSHRKHHRRHKRGAHRSTLHRASYPD